MKILDRYLLTQFAKALALGLVAFLLIYLVIDFFEKIGDYIDKGTTAWTVARLYLFKTPYIVVLVLPIAMLLASLFTIGRLSRDRELTAALAAGVPLPRLLLPLLAFGALISLGSYYFNDRVVTQSNLALEDLKRHEVNKEPRASHDVRRLVHKVGADGTLWWAEAYFVAQQRFENLVLLRYRGDSLRESYTARHAFWSGSQWRLVEGYHHRFATTADGSRPETGTQHFEHLDLSLPEQPLDFIREEKKPEAMDYGELREHILTQTHSGEQADRLWVDLHMKVSYPWANLIVVLLGAALSAQKRRISMAAGFGLTVGIAFVYLIFIRIGISLGHNQTLPPLLAAWSANFVFLLAGVGFLARASR
ncbi:MAG: LptF/LptG family permease [Candidatus Krumholzibacteriota bacterium]|nr:LptF/LptG family permease [Candidatus Krumholzibacteriota bacterium]